MGGLGDRLRSVAVEARSPDGHITVSTTASARSIDLSFRPGVYRRYEESELSSELAQALAHLFKLHRQAHREAVDAVVENAIHDDAIDFGQQHREYRQRAEQILATGASDDALVRASTRGLRTWRFIIARGTIRHLGEDEFMSDLNVAIRRLIGDNRVQTFHLKDEIYGLGYPMELRRALGLDPHPGRGAR